jgi:MoxR-like ATPase
MRNDQEIIAILEKAPQVLSKFKAEVKKSIVGQEEAVDLIIMSILCQGHSLLIGVPGLAKTLLITSVSKALGLDFSRIQFTPDLMPSDITGTELLNANREFVFHKGPVFANVVLADEINRTPPKTQAAMLEAMQEKRISAAGKTMPLPHPFFVLATQNPIEQEGTYPLPEAQLDRFLFSIAVDYPSLEEEIAVVRSTTIGERPELSAVLDAKGVLELQEALRAMPVSDDVIAYAVELARKTRPDALGKNELATEYFSWGAGPRASQSLVLAAKAKCMMLGDGTPTIAHVQSIAKPVLRHRVLINYKAKGEGKSVDDLIGQLF